MKKILFFGADNSGCAFYRCYMPAVELNRTGLAEAWFSFNSDWKGIKPLSYEPYFSEELKRKAQQLDSIHASNGKIAVEMNDIDVVVYERPYGETALSHLRLMKLFGKKTFIEHDDWMFGKKGHPCNKTAKIWKDSGVLSISTTMCNEADGIIVTSERLREKMLYLNPNICVVPNYIDSDLWQNRDSKSYDKDISYVASPAHTRDIKDISMTLWRLSKKYKTIFFGCEPVGIPDIEYNKGINIGEYPRAIAGLSKVGIAPLIRDEFSECKSPIKWFEYSMSGIAVVAQNYPPYSDFIEHGIDGMLADSPEEWRSAIEELLSDDNKREEMVRNAQDRILSEFTIQKNINKWADVLVN